MSVESPPSWARTNQPLEPLPAPGREALARVWRHDRTGLVLLGIAGVLLILVAGAVAERVMESGHVLGGVQIGDVDASGMSESEALAAVEQSAARIESSPITVQAGATKLSVDPTALGLHVDPGASVRAARRAGRSHNPVNQLTGTVLRRVRNDEVPFVLTVDQGRFNAVLDAWVAQTGRGLVDGALQFNGTQVVEVAPKSGVGIQREQARTQLLDALGHGKSDAGTLTIGPTTPAVDAHDVRVAARRARAVLAAPVTVTVNATPLVLTPQQVATTLHTEIKNSRLVLVADPLKLRAAFGAPLAALEVPPKDASFAISGTAVSVVPAVTGKLLNTDAVGKEIASGKHAFVGSVSDVNPTRTTAWAQKLNITEQVSTFTTYHPTGAPRVTNIHKAADTINGTIVAPGDTFSLNAALGQRTLAKGYVPAPQIGADLEDEDAVGGGVSQVSTTLYNATFFGCYKDVTHSVHALYLSRYPMGREATLNYPSIDNVFRNDSASGILIRAYYDAGSITITFYGNKGGRSCHAEGPHILQTIPSAPEYIDDPTKPVGYQKVLESGHTGYVVENFRIIDTPGQPEKRERYVERYATTTTKIARGTGAAPPAPTTPPATPAAPVAPPA